MLLMLMCAAALAVLADPAAAAKPTLKVLFVGNSLTFVNDLPGTMQALFASPASVALLAPTSSVMGGANFRDHTRDPSQYATAPDNLRTIEAIRRGGWDYVVLQDQVGSARRDFILILFR